MIPEKLAKATGSTVENAQKYASVLEESMIRFNIMTPRARAAFIANVDIESNNLSSVEESLYYKDAQRLANIYYRAFKGDATKAEPYTRNSARLGELLYQGYWGRGLIQITWLDNYQKCSKALGFDYVANPKLLTEPWHAAMSAAWYFSTHGCVQAAEANDFTDCVRRINPALMHLPERKASYANALQVGV